MLQDMSLEICSCFEVLRVLFVSDASFLAPFTDKPILGDIIIAVCIEQC